MSMRAKITSEEELEDVLSAPSEDDVQALSTVAGDILILGAAGKMGPTLARRLRLAADRAGLQRRIIAVARFSSNNVEQKLRARGIETLRCDLLKPGAMEMLPDAPNVIFMAARKFGTSGAEHLTWAMNVLLPGLVAERYRSSRIVAFSTGNVYPLVPLASGGATEELAPAPAGEYAQSALGRERLFEYGSAQYGTPVTLLRLNYAIDLRYGVLHDIARRVYEQRPVDVSMGMVNVIWQGDANSACLRSLKLCQSPPLILNITGPEMIAVRWLAVEFARRFGVEPRFEGEERDTALLSNASRANRLLGYPRVTLGQMIDWTAAWIAGGGVRWDKPTHFETRDGRF
jgi:nucleoside-diphosphate-sugar epimerase